MPAQVPPRFRWALRRYGGAPVWLLALVVVVLVAVAGALVVRPLLVPSRLSVPEQPLAVFIGDSYTQGVGASDPSDRWTTVVASRAGWTEDNLGRGGTGYATTAGIDGCGLSFCPDYQQMVQTAVDADPDIVVVAGGQNDFSAWSQDSARVTTAIDRVFRELRRALPRATIYAVGPSTTGGIGGPVVAMDAVVRAAARREDARYVSLIRPDVITSSMVLKDGGHVDDAGHLAIAERVLGAVRREGA